MIRLIDWARRAVTGLVLCLVFLSVGVADETGAADLAKAARRV